MKKSILVSILIFLYTFSFSQDVRKIFQKTFEKCQSVQNGHYEMTKFTKFKTKKDTVSSSYSCTFIKLKDDTLFSCAFKYLKFVNNGNSDDVMYTGEDFVELFPLDSTGKIVSKLKYPDEIKTRSKNFIFYSPLTDPKSSPVAEDFYFTDNNHSFKYLGEEKINSHSCYHISMNVLPHNEGPGPAKSFRLEYQYWINKDDMIPVQYSIALDILKNADTLHQYEKYILDKYELNTLKSDSSLKLSSIPSYFNLQEYSPYVRPLLLPRDTIAPPWSLTSLKDEKVSLSDFKGKLILIDFFYKSCYPCLQALPAIQALNDKYGKDGLKVIGIDPFDKKESDIAEFLSKRGISYTVLLAEKEFAKTYHVSGYPTLYLISKEGKIIYVQEGYKKGIEETLEKIIRENL
jgi:thiol-disulfide isomerase/thioredoxin